MFPDDAFVPLLGTISKGKKFSVQINHLEGNWQYKVEKQGRD